MQVNWDEVDREKGQLEEEQRLLACHAKVGSAEYKDWVTKKFHQKTFVDPVTGASRELYVFDHVNTGPYKEGEEEHNLIAMSRELPDVRGGLHGAGAEADVVAAMKSIKLSEARLKTYEQF